MFNSSKNSTVSVPLDFFSQLRKSLNISQKTLIIIGIAILVVALVLIGIIAFFIRRCLKGDDSNKKRKKTEGDGKDIFGDDAEKYDSVYGYIDLNVTYERKRKKLIIRDLQANNLKSPSPDPPDCYLKVFLKNSKGKKVNLKKSKIRVDNYTPFFNETFVYTFDNVKDAVVYFQVIDNNPNGSDILLGEGKLEMKRLDSDTYIGSVCPTYVILERSSEKTGLGDLCVILCSRGDSLRIVLLEAKDLVYKYAKSKYIGSFTYPSVHAKITVYVKKDAKKRFTTKRLHNTENPYFHETFDVVLKRIHLGSTCIKITIMESLPGKPSKKVGKLFIGSPTVNPLINAIGKFHWEQAIYDQKVPKAMWHSLCP